MTDDQEPGRRPFGRDAARHLEEQLVSLLRAQPADNRHHLGVGRQAERTPCARRVLGLRIVVEQDRITGQQDPLGVDPTGVDDPLPQRVRDGDHVCRASNQGVVDPLRHLFLPGIRDPAVDGGEVGHAGDCRGGHGQPPGQGIVALHQVDAEAADQPGEAQGGARIDPAPDRERLHRHAHLPRPIDEGIRRIGRHGNAEDQAEAAVIERAVGIEDRLARPADERGVSQIQDLQRAGPDLGLHGYGSSASRHANSALVLVMSSCTPTRRKV